MRACELTNAEKVQIHFMAKEMKHGYVQVARMYGIKPTDVPSILDEVEEARVDFNTREPVVYRRHYVNPKRKAPAASKTVSKPSDDSLKALLNKFSKK